MSDCSLSLIDWISDTCPQGCTDCSLFRYNKSHVCLSLQLHFTDDAGEEPVELYHKLKLYGEDDPSGQASTKKPVSSQGISRSCSLCNIP